MVLVLRATTTSGAADATLRSVCLISLAHCLSLACNSLALDLRLLTGNSDGDCTTGAVRATDAEIALLLELTCLAVLAWGQTLLHAVCWLSIPCHCFLLVGLMIFVRIGEGVSPLPSSGTTLPQLGGLCSQLALLRTVAAGQVSVAHDECVTGVEVLWADELRLSEPLA